MIDGKRVLCIIPARGGSKGLPGKNIKRFLGKPLIAHSIAHAHAVRLIDRTIVSTDDASIARAARRHGAEVPFTRPAKLATSRASSLDVLRHAVSFMRERANFAAEIVVLLQPTSPLRLPRDVEQCVKSLVKSGADNVFSVCHAAANPYFNLVEQKLDGFVELSKAGDFAGRQQAPAVYEINGAVYAWWTEVLMKSDRVVGPRSATFVMPRERSVDIDDQLDFDVAVAVGKAKARRKG